MPPELVPFPKLNVNLKGPRGEYNILSVTNKMLTIYQDIDARGRNVFEVFLWVFVFPSLYLPVLFTQGFVVGKKMV